MSKRDKIKKEAKQFVDDHKPKVSCEGFSLGTLDPQVAVEVDGEYMSVVDALALKVGQNLERDQWGIFKEEQ